MSRENTAAQNADFFTARAAAMASFHTRREAAIAAMVEEARDVIAGKSFRYRDELYLVLHAAAKSAKGRSLSASEEADVKSVTLALWKEYAESNNIDICLRSEPQYRALVLALTLRDEQQRRKSA